MKVKVISFIGCLFGILCTGLNAEIEPIRTTGRAQLAVKGYDVVAYFVQSNAVKGVKDIVHEWKDANWRFTSQENLKLFRDSPEKYAPQFGGYCAWAVSQGYTAGIDPDAWTINEGKLYLNYSRRIQKKWMKEMKSNIDKGHENWPKVLAGEKK